VLTFTDSSTTSSTFLTTLLPQAGTNGTIVARASVQTSNQTSHKSFISDFSHLLEASFKYSSHLTVQTQ